MSEVLQMNDLEKNQYPMKVMEKIHPYLKLYQNRAELREALLEMVNGAIQVHDLEMEMMTEIESLKSIDISEPNQIRMNKLYNIEKKSAMVRESMMDSLLQVIMRFNQIQPKDQLRTRLFTIVVYYEIILNSQNALKEIKSKKCSDRFDPTLMKELKDLLGETSGSKRNDDWKSLIKKWFDSDAYNALNQPENITHIPKSLLNLFSLLESIKLDE
jgi:hypothetical protein